MDEHIFKLEDYLAFSEHEETLVRKWAMKSLIRLYPGKKITQKKIFNAILKDSQNKEIQYILGDYLLKHGSKISFDFILNYLDKINNIGIKAKLLESLASRTSEMDEKKIDEIYKCTEDIINNIKQIKNDQEVIAFFKLEDVLSKLQTPDSYHILKTIEKNLKMNDMFLSRHYQRVFKYKKAEDISSLLEKLFANYKNVDNNNFDNILISYSELFLGQEFARYVISNLGYAEDLNTFIENLEYYWSNNSAVLELNDIIDEKNLIYYSNDNYTNIIHFIIDVLFKGLKERYPILSKDSGSKNDTIDWIILHRKEMNEGDFWILLFIRSIINIKKGIKDNFKLRSIVHFLLSALIVFLEDNNYQEMIEKAKEDEDYLWEIFTLDRENIPPEISDLLLARVDHFEDRMIKLLKENKYDAYIKRVLDLINNTEIQKYLPYIFKVIDRKQGDYVKEKVIEILENNISEVPLEALEKAIIEGDSSGRIYLTSLLKYYPCERAAQFLIDCWEDNIIDIFDQYVHQLMYIGSEKGYQYLDEIMELDMPVYFHEALLILAIINGEDQFIINDYYQDLKKAREELNNSSLDFSSPFKLDTSNEEQLDKIDEVYAKKDNGTIVRIQEKVGRNDPCPCGSGKKYKKCCG